MCEYTTKRNIVWIVHILLIGIKEGENVFVKKEKARASCQVPVIHVIRENTMSHANVRIPGKKSTKCSKLKRVELYIWNCMPEL